MSSSNKTLSLLTATALAAGLGMTASASALSMSDLAQGYLVAGQAAKASTDAKAADKAQAAANKLALTRMQALPFAQQATFEQEIGFEGMGLDEQGVANLQKQQQLARNLNEKGFSAAKEALDNDIEKIATDKKLKGEDPGTQLELRSDAAGELQLFLQQHQRAPDAGERAKILSAVALKQATRPRVLDSLRGPGQEFPFQRKQREGASIERRQDKNGVMREKRADGRWYPVKE